MQTHWKGVRLAASMMILLAVILLPVSAAPGDYLPGDLDLSFADGAGRRITSFDGNTFAAALALSPSGKIVVAGTVARLPTTDFAVAQYLADGTPDPVFGDGSGRATVDFSVPPANPDDPGIPRADSATAMVVQPDGAILLGGFSNDANSGDFGLARLTSTGVLDPSFGSGGLVRTGFPGNHQLGHDEIAAIGLQSGGKIVAAGRVWNGSLYTVGLARYCSNGHLDDGLACGGPGFGASGMITMPFNNRAEVPYAMHVLADDRFLLAGMMGGSGIPGLTDFAVWGFCANGQLATQAACGWTFGSGGIVHTNFAGEGGSSGEEAYALDVQADGKIVVAGSAGVNPTDGEDYAVARYNPDGSLDPSFGSGGLAHFNVSSPYESAYALALAPDGKILIAGVQAPSNMPMVLLRLCANGQIDNGANCGPAMFGQGGHVYTSFTIPIRTNAPSGMLLQADGKLLVAGSYTDNAVSFGLARFYGGMRFTSPALSPGGAVTLGSTGAQVQLLQGGPCSFAVEKDSLFPGGSADPGEIPALWRITNANACSYQLTLSLCYSDQELQAGGIGSEAALSLYHSSDGSAWTKAGGTVDAAANCASLSGIQSLDKYWTLMAGTAPPEVKLYLPMVRR